MALGVPVDSAKQIASLLVSFGLINEDQFNHARTSSTEGGRCLIETLIDFGFTNEKTIANNKYSNLNVIILLS